MLRIGIYSLKTSRQRQVPEPGVGAGAGAGVGEETVGAVSAVLVFESSEDALRYGGMLEDDARAGMDLKP